MTMAAREFSLDDIARGEALFKGPCTFVKGVVRVEDLPQDARPEVAFAGRSNVGKSNLINALTGQKSLARVSVTPGRTRGSTSSPSARTPDLTSSICRAMAMRGHRKRR